MKIHQRSIVTVVVASAMAILACSPVGGATATKRPAPTDTQAAVSVNATATTAGGEATAGPPTEGAAPTTESGAATATSAAGGEATETATPTYDAIAAQLTVPPLLTANAATATAATGAVHQWAAAAQASSQYGDLDWAATQATGAPNGPTDCGDNKTSWASAGNAGSDYLELVYTTTVVPVAVNIYETNGAGSIVKVEVEEASGTAHTIYSGLPLVSQQCPRIFSIPATGVTAKVNRVKVYVDQSVVKTWDEIDAVELVGNP